MQVLFDRFGISPVRGLLGAPPADGWDRHASVVQAASLAASIPALIASGSFRAEVSRLEAPGLDRWLLDAPLPEARALFRDYAMLTQACMWSEDEPLSVLPANLARPLAALAERLGVVPILNYAAYVLDNCVTTDAETRPSVEYARPLRTFTDDPMEDWFLRIHFAIEARAGAVLASMFQCLAAADREDTAGCTDTLLAIAHEWAALGKIFSRMAEGCSGEFFFYTLRHYWHGWLNNPALPEGLVYAGVERFSGVPQQFRGVAGSQSSLLRVMDLLLGITHQDNELTRYLSALDSYRPPEHVRLVAWLQTSPALRKLQELARSAPVRTAIDACRTKIASFRSLHAHYAQAYIAGHVADSQSNVPDRGTGGTSFSAHLKAMEENSAPKARS